MAEVEAKPQIQEEQNSANTPADLLSNKSENKSNSLNTFSNSNNWFQKLIILLIAAGYPLKAIWDFVVKPLWDKLNERKRGELEVNVESSSKSEPSPPIVSQPLPNSEPQWDDSAFPALANAEANQPPIISNNNQPPFVPSAA